MPDTDRSDLLGDGPPPIVQRITDSILVADDGSVTNWMSCRPELLDPAGHLRLGAIVFVADGAGGLSGGISSREGTWVVTADLDVQLTAPILGRDLRVVGRTIRSGSTSVVCDLDVFADDPSVADDAGSSSGWLERVGIGSMANHLHESDMRPPSSRWARGRRIRNGGADQPTLDRTLVDHLRMTEGPDGSVDLPLDDEMRNPWGIMHGGMVAIGAEETVLRHAARFDDAAGWSAVGMAVRYLAPTRVGPARFTVTATTESADERTHRVVLTDRGADRVTAQVTVRLRRNRPGS